MKKIIIIILFLFICISNIYSSEEDFYNFMKNIENELWRAIELYILENIAYDFNGNFNFIILYDYYKINLLNIKMEIRNNINLYNENESIKNIIILIDYEINNLINRNDEIIYPIYSDTVVKRMKYLLRLIETIYILKDNEYIIQNHNIE